MNFEFVQMPHWPLLTWLAECPRSASTVRVLHGPRVETDWLRAKRSQWIRRGRLPPIPSVGLDRMIHKNVDSFAGWAKHQPGLWRLAGRLEGQPTYLRRFLFPWALERTKAKYAID